MASNKTVDLNEFGTSSPNSEHPGVLRRWCKSFALSPQVVSRVAVILGALCVIKLVLLISLRKHVQELHWRVNLDTLSGLGVFSFYAVAVVLVGCLFQFGRQCQAVGVRAVRAANATVLVFSGLVIFLTFHEGDKNLVYPVMTGVLKWWQLWSYLSLNLFFRPPYLAVWVFGYVAMYYVLARTGRERHVLTLTAVFAGLYWVFCLREFMVRRDDLWVVLLFGLGSLFMLQFARRPFRAAWLLLPAIWTLFTWFLFSLGEVDLANLQPYFLMLTGCLTVLFVAATLMAKREGFLNPWLNLVSFLFVGTLLLSNAHYPISINYNNLLGFAAKFPSYFLGELLVAAIVAIIAAVWLRLRATGNLKWLDLVGIGLIGWAILDLRLTQLMGVRLGWDLISFANDPKMMLKMALPYLPLLAVVMLAVCGAYFLAVRRLTASLNSHGFVRESAGKQSAGWCLLGGFAMFAVLGAVINKPDNVRGQSVFRFVQTSPVWRSAWKPTLSPKEFFQESQALGMPDWRRPDQAREDRPRRDLNVLLIFQESTFNQHLSLFSGDKETQPELKRYQDRMEVFPNFFSSFASSIHARFAAFAGLYPIQDFSRFTLEPVPVKSIFELLGENGYECSMFYSSFYDYTGFRSFLRGRNLAAMYDADTMPGANSSERVLWGLKEEAVTRAIRQQIRKHAADGKRFFLTYVPAAPHYPYDKTPREFCKFRAQTFRDFTPLYLNALLYMDWNIASILDELKETGLLDQTLVVITSDHGEMLGENGGPFGHGWRITPELANVPLIIMDPDRKGYRVNANVGSQVDLLPTLMDTLGLPLSPGELYQGRSLYQSTLSDDRPVYLNSYEDFAVVAGEEIRIASRRDERGHEPVPPGLTSQIRNLGAVTTFVESNQAGPSLSIRRFDDFQEGLLRNYARYRDFLLTPQTSEVTLRQP
ncbi:MAG TPA: sulfatase-like hydrolase/transferase [Verrucomicrobiae bacterium]|nr:sulfatase-like hydrolase/transferase [Verrucomicrobiae bacterium]